MGKEALMDLCRVRRWKLLEVTPDLLIRLLYIPPDEWFQIGQGAIKVVKDPVPKDAKVVRVSVSDRGMVIFVLESEEFTPVDEAGVIPRLEPIFMAR